MVHYSCDGCGKILGCDTDPRYKVKIESYLASGLDEDFESEGLQNGCVDFCEADEDDMDDDLEEIEYNTFQFDLCQSCYRNYAKNPISVKNIQSKRFSEN